MIHPPDLRAFWAEHAAWSTATFGSTTERGPTGPLKHLAKEIQEVLARPDDIEEHADVGLLWMDAARRSGFTYDQLVAAMWAKLERNRVRVWPKTSATEPVEHVKGEGE